MMASFWGALSFAAFGLARVAGVGAEVDFLGREGFVVKWGGGGVRA